MSAPQVLHAQATALKDRLWGPDFARGLALLGIIVANVYYYVGAPSSGIVAKRVYEGGPEISSPDTWVDVFSLLFFDNRGFPLFSLLFGYGIAMLYAKSQQRGETAGQFLLQMLKRHCLLLAVGVVHGLFFFAGDIITTYAILGMILSLILVAPRVVWLVLFIACAILAPFFGVLDVLGATFVPVGHSGELIGSEAIEVSADSALAALGWRAFSFITAVFTLLFFAPLIFFPMLLGTWLYRKNFFGALATGSPATRQAKPSRYILIATIGIAISLLGALPAVFYYLQPVELGFWQALWIGFSNQLGGYAGGVGYAAIALLLTWHKPKILLPVVALGTLSMSGYLFQTLAAVIAYPNFTLGMAEQWGSGEAFIFSLAVWLLSVIGAFLLYRAGKRGPVEWGIRRILYGKPTDPAQNLDRTQ